MRVNSTWMRLVSPVLALSLGAVPLAAQNLIVNGGFEAGLSGWSVSGATSRGSCEKNWNTNGTGGTPSGTYYAPGGTDCMGVGTAYAGTMSAFNSFDGRGPLNYYLTQSFVMPGGVTDARLRFTEAARHAIFAGRASRTLDVFLISTSGAVNPFTYTAAPGGTFATGAGHDWTSHDLDITSFALANAGDGMTIVFEAYVPEAFSGPAGMGLDEVSVDVRTGGSVVPEPASIVLLGSGLLFIGGVAARRRNRA